MNGRIKILTYLLITTLTTTAQTELTIKEVISIFQSDTRFEDGGADWIQFEEQLINLQQNKVSLNSANIEELQTIPFLDPFIAYNISRYRRQSGNIINYYELQNIKGLNREWIEILKLFTTLENTKRELNFKNLWGQGRHTFAIRSQYVHQKAEGFKNGFEGSETAWYSRYRFNYFNTVFVGFTLQQDAGEVYPTQFPYISDYSSFHAEVRLNKKVQKIIIGDFYANYGQGLSLWTSLAYGKMAQSTETQRYGKGVAYYSGADENRFLRGAAIRTKFGNIVTDVFASKNNIDVSLNTNNKATTLVSSGLHRTNTEISKRNNQNVSTIGGHVELKGNVANIGATAYYYKFSIPFVKGEQPYQQHKFYGNENAVVALDYHIMLQKGFLFGELSHSTLESKTAAIAGLKLTPVDIFQFTISGRSIPSGFHTLYNAPFSETGNAGEHGIYLGTEIQLHRKVKLNAYADRFKFDWLRFSNSSFSIGEDYLIQLNYQPQFNLTTYIRYRQRIGNASIISDQLDIPTQYNSQTIRWNLRYKMSNQLTWTTRVEYKDFNHNSTGVLMYQDLSVGFLKIPLTLDFRLSVFNTQTFETAIYTREDDLPYSYNLALMNDEGIKHYVMLKYTYKKLDFWLRYAYWWYPRKQTIGSGLDEIIGQEKTVIKAMLRIKL